MFHVQITWFTHSHCCCLVTQPCPTLSNLMNCSTTGFPVLHYLPEFTQIPCSLNWWCHPTISSSVIPFSCLQSFPASECFLMRQLLASGDPNPGASAPASIFPMNFKDWFPLGLTDLITLLSKGLSSLLYTVQKYQFFGAQPSLWPKSQIHKWLLEKL